MTGNEQAFASMGAKGLTKREYFAALAMQAEIIADRNGEYGEIAGGAVIMADALIKELGRRNADQSGAIGDTGTGKNLDG